ncbi:MAG: hypothetical protein NVSMB9_22620 [Isosphaeraceae bacterium]
MEGVEVESGAAVMVDMGETTCCVVLVGAGAVSSGPSIEQYLEKEGGHSPIWKFFGKDLEKGSVSP